MKKAAGLFFLSVLLLPLTVSAQEPTLVVPAGYRVSQIFSKLPETNSFTFDFDGNFIFSQNLNGNFRIFKSNPQGNQTVLLERTSEPISSVSFFQGQVYATIKGRIAILHKGHLMDIVTGLPAYGDYANGPVIFDNGKMYFSVGTATNSGIVGPDNVWVKSQPSIHDLACTDLKINQLNTQTDNFLTKKQGDMAAVGSFMPFNTPDFSDTLTASLKCNGAIMSANPDGSGLQVYAYGFHNPKGISIDSKGKLYALDQAMEDRGLRPVKDGKDALYAVDEHTWYGWPDFNAGNPVDGPLLKQDPNPAPVPIAAFDPERLSDFVVSLFGPDSGLVINDNNKISEINLKSGKLSDFVMAPDKITQIKFGPDNKLYVLTDNGKNSNLYQIDSTAPASIVGSTERKGGININWLISALVTILGMSAAYLIFRQQQKTV